MRIPVLHPNGDPARGKALLLAAQFQAPMGRLGDADVPHGTKGDPKQKNTVEINLDIS